MSRDEGELVLETGTTGKLSREFIVHDETRTIPMNSATCNLSARVSTHDLRLLIWLKKWSPPDRPGRLKKSTQTPHIISQLWNDVLDLPLPFISHVENHGQKALF